MVAPLRFPPHVIRPPEDPADLAMHAVISASVDLALQVTEATTADRAMALRRRLGSLIGILMQVELSALKKMDELE